MPSAAVTYIAAKLSGQPEPRIEHKPTAPHNMHAIRRRMGGITRAIIFVFAFFIYYHVEAAEEVLQR